jgi:nucleotide-binding universal stress UspA family protein
LRAISEPNEEASATEYLQNVAKRLSAFGVEVTVAVEREPPSQAIAQAATQTDLVILSTHGRGGWDRLRHGSVAERATRTLAAPTLLVRAVARA